MQFGDRWPHQDAKSKIMLMTMQKNMKRRLAVKETCHFLNNRRTLTLVCAMRKYTFLFLSLLTLLLILREKKTALESESIPFFILLVLVDVYW
jgi:hypothetical protein